MMAVPVPDFYTASVAEQSHRLRDMACRAAVLWPGRWQVDRLLKYRENAVFALSSATDGRVVLRIHRPGYHQVAALKSELVWMQALSEAGFCVPVLRTGHDGGVLQVVEAPGIPEPRFVDMQDHMPGVPVSEVTDIRTLENIYVDVGRQLAAMHAHSMRWVAPEGFHRPSWDSDGLIGQSPLWGDFRQLPALSGNDARRVAEAVAQAERDLREFGDGRDRFGMIHADGIADNILYDPHAGPRLIDFDDCGHGWFLFDLATCLFFHEDHPGYPVISESFLGSYAQAGKLDASMRRAMPLFMFLRALTYLGWVHTRAETGTAREMTSFFVERAARLADSYLKGRPTSFGAGIS
ncbi:phosphotransferase [Komagataeibacter sp. FXV2]|nr:phosphotransferase [Komagataeibacter sp. FXV2]